MFLSVKRKYKMRYLVLSLLVGCLGCPGAPTINTPPDAGQSEADMTSGQADAGSDGSNLNRRLAMLVWLLLHQRVMLGFLSKKQR